MILETGKYLLYLAIILAWAVFVMNLRNKSYKSIFYVNLVSFIGIVISYILMIVVLTSEDYSIAMVYNYTSSTMTLAERISAAWVARAPIMTLWGLYMVLLSILTTVYVKDQFESPIIKNMMNLMYFFSAIIISFAVSPRPGAFDPLEIAEGASVPFDGLGLVPSLLSKWNLIHPPLAFLGYSSFIVPFAAGIAILNAKKKGIEESPKAYYLMDVFMLLGWCLNSILLLAGSMWGYEENWSGFWAWDPVEIASVVMWGCATLYFHARSLVKSDHPLRALTGTFGWLGVAFASFIVRSGYIGGLHSYTSSAQAIVFGTMLVASVSYVAYIAIRSKLNFMPEEIEEIGGEKLVHKLTFWLIVGLIMVNVIGLIIQLFSAIFRDIVQIPYWYYIPLNVVILVSLAVLLPFCEIRWKNLRASPQRYYILAYAVFGVVFFVLSQMTSILLILLSTAVMVALLLQLQTGINALWSKHNMRKIGKHLVHIATLLLILSYMSANFTSDPLELTINQKELTTIDEFEIKIIVENYVDISDRSIGRINITIYDMSDNFMDNLELTHGFYRDAEGNTEFWTRGDFMITPLYDLFFGLGDSLSSQGNAPIALDIFQVSNANVFRFSFFTVFALSIIAIIMVTKRKNAVPQE